MPSVQASRMTFAAAPDALQGAVAAGILGCGSVILGASETCGKLLDEVRQRTPADGDYEVTAAAVIAEYRAERRAIPATAIRCTRRATPRVGALFAVAERADADITYVRIAEAIERVIPDVLGKPLMLNVSAAIPAVLLGVGFPIGALKGVPILARTAGLIGHLTEEMGRSIGFALSYQATRELVYDGLAPDGFTPDA